MILQKNTHVLILLVVFFNINFISSATINAQGKNIINIETLKLISRTMKISKSYLGHLEPVDRVILKTEIDGTIEKIDFDQGQAVKQGQVLFHISTRELNLNVIAAKSRYNQALSEYNTQKQLFLSNQPNDLLASLQIQEKDNISETELKSVNINKQTGIRQLELQVKIAQSGYDQALINYKLQKKLFLKKQYSKASMMKTSDLEGQNNQILLKDFDSTTEKKSVHLLTKQQETQTRISATNYKQVLSDYGKQKTLYDKNISNISTLEKHSNQLEISLQKLQLDRLKLEQSIIQDKTRLETYANNFKVAKARLELSKLDLEKAKLSDQASIKARTDQLKQLKSYEKLRSKGKTLISVYIGTKSLELQLKIAENDYAHVLANYRTQKTLFNKNMINTATLEGFYNALKMAQFKFQLANLSYQQSKIQDNSRLDNVKDSMEIAKVQYELAKVKMEKSKIKAPFNSIAKDKISHVGEFIQKGGRLVELMDISKVIAKVNIPETEVRYIRTGGRALVTMDAFPGKKYTGTIKTLGLEADLKSRSFPVEVIISNKNKKLYPGMMSRVEIVTRVKKNQIIVPRFAVLDRERGAVVFIENNNEVLLKTVTLGKMIKDEVQILSGLKSGDKLVVVGQNLLANKEKVNVVKLNKQVK